MVHDSTLWSPLVFVGSDPCAPKINRVLLSLWRSSGVRSAGVTNEFFWRVTTLLPACCDPPAWQHSSPVVQQSDPSLGKVGLTFQWYCFHAEVVLGKLFHLLPYPQLTCICKNRCVLPFQVLLTNSFMELAVSDPNGPVRATEKLAITRERPESTAVRFLQLEVGEHPLYYSTFHWYGWEVDFFPPWTCTSLH